jgi:hypothetical protein
MEAKARLSQRDIFTYAAKEVGNEERRTPTCFPETLQQIEAALQRPPKCFSVAVTVVYRRRMRKWLQIGSRMLLINRLLARRKYQTRRPW